MRILRFTAPAALVTTLGFFAACGDDGGSAAGGGDSGTGSDGSVQVGGDAGARGDGSAGADASPDAAVDRDASGSDAGDAGDASDAVDAGDAADASALPDAGDVPDAGVTCLALAPVVPPIKVVSVVASGIGTALFAAQPPGSTDWYVVDQAGIIRIVRGGVVLPTPFLDISKGFGTNPSERGLLSLAFHPNYAVNGRFFVMGSPATGADGSFAPNGADAVVEYVRSANPDVAKDTKVQNIVVLPSSAENHNGGTIQFGLDHFLYVGTGDGGGSCESSQPGAVQDTTKLFGKILRLDVDAAPPFGASGNPFADDARVFHYGFRNPFRFNFDRLTGDLYIGDVGQVSYEEISFVPNGVKGANFGWPAFEGAAGGTCGAKPLGGPSPHTPPIVSIDRRAGSTSPFADFRAIIGGAVYRGAAIPALAGVYLFADASGGELGALRRCGDQTYGPVAVPLSSIPAPNGLGAITSFVQGNDGELYVVYGFSHFGKIVLQ